MAPQIQAYRVGPWFDVDGDNTLRLDYPLDENSIVFDVGGYLGDWAEPIYDRYKSTIYVFEPVPEFYEKLHNRFANNPRIHVYNFGLSNYTGDAEFAQLDNQSSAFIQNGNSLKVKMKDIIEFMDEQKIRHVDLMKINIEGGEYDLLNRLVDQKRLDQFENLQIQFHDFFDDAAQRVAKLRGAFKITHYPTYMFDFVWENWQKKPSDQTVYSQIQHLGDINSKLQQDLVKARLELAAATDYKNDLENELSALRKRLARIENTSAYKAFRKVKQIINH